MKNLILMIALVTLTVTNSYAQTVTLVTDNRDKLFFGLKVGSNYSNVYDSQGENFVADA